MDYRFIACLMVSDRFTGHMAVKKIKAHSRPELYEAIQAALQEQEREPISEEVAEA